jgi:RNA polymerase sigma-70 factor, ECF subfamily
MKQIQRKKEIFIKAYDEYSDTIFRYCLFHIFDREKAKDLMQETFTKTWEYIIKDEKEIENIRAFLYRVAHNLCVNEIVRSKAYSLDEMMEKIGFDPQDSIVPSQEDDTEISLLINKMQRLNANERDLLTMRYINDLKVSEIAEILNSIPNTISVKISRAEKSLKKIYKENGKQ